MGVEVLVDRETGRAAIYCNTNDWAFGPLFASEEEAVAFLEWHQEDGGLDPREMGDQGLESAFNRFRKARAESEAP